MSGRKGSLGRWAGAWGIRQGREGGQREDEEGT